MVFKLNLFLILLVVLGVPIVAGELNMIVTDSGVVFSDGNFDSWNATVKPEKTIVPIVVLTITPNPVSTINPIPTIVPAVNLTVNTTLVITPNTTPVVIEESAPAQQDSSNQAQSFAGFGRGIVSTGFTVKINSPTEVVDNREVYTASGLFKLHAEHGYN